MSSFARLRQLGIELEYCLNHGLTTSLYYSDPEQNLVELQVDNFGNWDASTEWMRSSENFRQNPVGAFFNPDAFLPPTRPVRRSSNCKKTRTRRHIPLRSRQTCISLRSADTRSALWINGSKRWVLGSNGAENRYKEPSTNGGRAPDFIWDTEHMKPLH
jgi:hypothetical protein